MQAAILRALEGDKGLGKPEEDDFRGGSSGEEEEEEEEQDAGSSGEEDLSDSAPGGEGAAQDAGQEDGHDEEEEDFGSDDGVEAGPGTDNDTNSEGDEEESGAWRGGEGAGDKAASFARAFAKIMDAPGGGAAAAAATGSGAPILAASKSLVRARAEEEAGAKADRAAKRLRLEMRQRGHAVPTRRGVDPAADAHEKALQRLATKGVVRLFNAVAKAQKQLREAEEASGSKARAARLGKASFLAELKGAAAGGATMAREQAVVPSAPAPRGAAAATGKKQAAARRRGAPQADSSDEEGPGWDVLQQGFAGLQGGSKMKDWDKKQSEDEGPDDEAAGAGSSSDDGEDGCASLHSARSFPGYSRFRAPVNARIAEPKLQMVSFGGVVANTLFGLSWVSWIFALAGAGAMQNACGGYFGKAVDVKGIPTYVEGCTTAANTSFIWWAVWFEFVVLVLLSIAQCFRRSALLITKQIYLAMVSVVLMVAANHAVIGMSTWDGSMRVASQVCLAGLIVSIFANLVMMLVFGGEAGYLLPGAKDVGEPQPNFAELASQQNFGSAATSAPAFQPVPSAYQSSVSIVTYNVLCQTFATRQRLPHVFPRWLEWDHRWRLLQQELAAFQADVVCLQEVTPDRWNDIKDHMLSLGYASVLQSKAISHGSHNVVATFYRAAKLRLPLWLVNLHLEGSPYRPNDRVSQLKSALQRLAHHLESASAEPPEAADVAIAGDFNSFMGDSPCWLLRRGRLERNHTDAVCPAVPTTKQSIAHPFPLVEVYDVAGVKLAFTRKTHHFSHPPIDFIWCSRHMHVSAVMRPLQAEQREYVNKHFLPNRMQPSDHLPLGVILRLSDAEEEGERASDGGLAAAATAGPGSSPGLDQAAVNGSATTANGTAAASAASSDIEESQP
eukprot:scaffold1.g5315.t1